MPQWRDVHSGTDGTSFFPDACTSAPPHQMLSRLQVWAILYKRLTQPPSAEWRRTYKALLVVQHLVTHSSQFAVSRADEHAARSLPLGTAVGPLGHSVDFRGSCGCRSSTSSTMLERWRRC